MLVFAALIFLSVAQASHPEERGRKSCLMNDMGG
jgi:hypothetical protein